MCPQFSSFKGYKNRNGVGPAIYYYEKHTLRKIFLEYEEFITIIPDEYKLKIDSYDDLLDLVENGTLKAEELDIQL